MTSLLPLELAHPCACPATSSTRRVVIASTIVWAVVMSGCTTGPTSRESTVPPSDVAMPAVTTSPLPAIVAVSPPSTAVSATVLSTSVTTVTAQATDAEPPALTTLPTPATVAEPPAPVPTPPTSIEALPPAQTAPDETDPNVIVPKMLGVEAAAKRAFKAFAECYQSPSMCDPSAVYAADSPALTHLQTFIADAITSGRYLSKNERGSYINVETYTFPTQLDATAIICMYDAGITLGPPNAQGKPTVIDDSIISAKLEEKFVLVGDTWTASEILSRVELGSGEHCQRL